MKDNRTVQIEVNNWKEEWREMPEYNNKVKEEPEVVVKVRFQTSKDFDEFKEKLKQVLETNKPFDGMQRKKEKSFNYPVQEKSSDYICK